MRLPKKIMHFGGIVVILLGAVLTLTGAYGFFAGTGDKVFSIIGTLVLLGGIAVNYIGLRLSRLTTLSAVLGTCFVSVPVILIEFGYNLVAGVVAVVFGYLSLAALFIWLTT